MENNSLQDDTLSLLKAGKLLGCKRLKLSCNLTQFPAEIFTLANTLEILDLSNNLLESLPDDLHKLHRLRILFCSSNQFTHLPEVLGQCEHLSMIGFKANQISHIAESAIPTKALRWLILTDNLLTTLPNAVGDCQHMQKLMLAGNQLSALPKSLANCQKLELLRISANRFESLPKWLFDLPKLSWLAFAANPFSDRIEEQLIAQHIIPQAIPQVDWNDLEIQQLLGEGASGLIYRARLQAKQSLTNALQTSDVAVKMFKAGLTSDGLPRCEMHATTLAGQHTNLLGMCGVVAHHPNGQAGMVMPLMDENLVVLANPPSFESCSRDVYANNTKIEVKKVLSIAHSIASAVAHLHANGMTHGDLYAHNILSDPLSNAESSTVLSDLGAASFLPQDNPKQSEQLQRIESHAFACLLEELLHRCEVKNIEDETLVKALWHLQSEGAQTINAKRPLFKAIEAKLALIKATKIEPNKKS